MSELKNIPRNDDIEKYLSDLDNLLETNQFPSNDISDYTHHHKGFTLKKFVMKGRELLRCILVEVSK